MYCNGKSCKLIGSSLTVHLCQRVEEESLIKNSSACKDYLIEAMKYHLLPADQRALMKTARTRMRTPACCPKVLTHYEHLHPHQNSM